ncbi:MAG: ankyrin repeat domain-containing protein [Methylococcales bacterium]
MYIDFSSFFDQSLREVAGFYPAKSHEKAFLRISDGINYHHCVFFLQGVKGVGKTHILKRLYRKPESSLRKAWLSERQPNIDIIMQSFADLYDMHWDSTKPNELRKRLVADVKNKQIPVLYIDNVRTLDVETMIALSNILRWRKHTLGKVIFAGRFKLNPVLKIFLKNSNIKPMHCRLQPLDEAEIHAYLVQLSRASGYVGKSPFDKASIHALIKHSQGIPIKINQLCDFCLFMARNRNHLMLDVALVNQAAAGLQKLKLWRRNKKIVDKEQAPVIADNTSSSKDHYLSAIPVSETSIVTSLSVNENEMSQSTDTNKLGFKRTSRYLSDEWEKAIDSYLLKHPDDNNNRQIIDHSRESYFPKIWSFTSLLILLLAIGGYYFLDHFNYITDSLPENFSPWHSKNVNDKPNISENSIKNVSSNEGSSNISKVDLGHSLDRENIESALVLAVWNNKMLEIKELLQLGVDINTRNHFKQTPLMIAAILGNMNIVTILLENGADFDSIDTNGLTALMLAARNGQLSVAELLLNNGADVNVQDKRGLTALMHAVSFGHEKTVEIILKYKPTLEVQDNKSEDGMQGESTGVTTLSQRDQNISQMIQTTL